MKESLRVPHFPPSAFWAAVGQTAAQGHKRRELHRRREPYRNGARAAQHLCTPGKNSQGTGFHSTTNWENQGLENRVRLIIYSSPTKAFFVRALFKTIHIHE